MMNVNDKVNQYINEYQQKLQGLQEKLQVTSDRINYLELEVRMLQEVEIPEAQTKALLEGTGEALVVKLKKSLTKYSEDLQVQRENQIIYTNAIRQFKINAGPEVAKLHASFSQEKAILEAKQYAKMCHAKKAYVDSLIEESKVLHEASRLDIRLQEMLVESGRKNGVYTDSSVRTTTTNTNDRRIYLPLSYHEVQRFINGNYTDSDYDYLKKYADKKAIQL
jgi:hypothetical protein